MQIGSNDLVSLVTTIRVDSKSVTMEEHLFRRSREFDRSIPYVFKRERSIVSLYRQVSAWTASLFEFIRHCVRKEPSMTKVIYILLIIYPCVLFDRLAFDGESTKRISV